jgi:two-component system response regulator TctD
VPFVRLLLVEDNRDLASWLARLLRADNYVVDCIADGESVLEGLDLGGYDLALVDLSLPKIDGMEVIREVRAKGCRLPILILTARDELRSRVEGLDAGADDYLTKPFEIEELEARVRALLRRREMPLAAELRFGPLSFDQTGRSFTLAGAHLHLSPREHAVLETLVRRSGRPVSKEALLEGTYGFDDEVNAAAIEVHVHRLRRKLEGSPVAIATLRGLGYMLKLEPN